MSFQSNGQINKVWDDIMDVYDYSNLESDQLGNCYMHYNNYNIGVDWLLLAKYNSKGIKLWDKIVYTDTSWTSDLSYEYFYIDDYNFPIIQFSSDDGVTEQHYLLKCDTSGNFIWKIETEVSQRCAFNNGNIYMTGHYLGEMVLYKYDSAGVLQFEASRPFAGGSYGQIPKIDNFENVFFSYRDSIYKIYKVDPTGLIIDSLFLNQSNNNQYYFAFYIDAQGNLIVPYDIRYPASGPADSTKFGLLKYDSSFNLIWDTGEFSFGQISSLAIDANDDIYIEVAWPIEGNGRVFKIAKINQNGNLMWVHDFGNIAGLTKYYDGTILFDPDNYPVIVGEYYPYGYDPQNSTQTNMFFIFQLDTTGAIREYEEFTANANLNLQQPPMMNNYSVQLDAMYSSTDQSHIYDICIKCPNLISGYVYFDENSNCIFDSLEWGLKNAIVEIVPGIEYLTTDSTGFYHAYLTDSTYEVLSLSYQNFSNTCAANPINITISNSLPVQDVNFGKYLDPNFNDLHIDLGHGPVRPGFNTLVVLNYQNRGGSIQSGTVNLVPEAFFSYVQSSQTPLFPGGDTIQWNFTNLLPGETRSINIVLSNPTSTSIGTPYSNEAIISGILVDSIPLDNYIIDIGSVTGAIDPYNKTVLPVGIGSEGYITTSDSILHYTINFENYGNDTAFTVIVIDTLDEDLDISTLKIGAISHPYTLDILNSKLLRFRFDNIMLTDTSNLNMNYGFINYYIEQKPELPVGTEITNSADIYFDYYLPVKTPVTLNTIFEPTGIIELSNYNLFQVYPNPVRNELQIDFQSPSQFIDVSIYDINGKLIDIKMVNSKSHIQIDYSNFENGVYILRLRNNETTFFRKIIKL